MKSLTATATLIVTLTLAAAPAAQAATAMHRAKHTVTRAIHRMARIVTNWKPGDPIPASSSLTEDITETATTSPKQPVR
ncbi:MAG TPA: hypothetical protein VEK79_03220 [Thermoanaerobaculia bacterium]|nr:hypothetical protein [Thermoanaerobaculia bacterium]